MVEKGSKLPGLSLLKIPARIIGPIKAVPFFFLMPRTVKRKTSLLVTGAVWMLLMHLVDLHWLVMPSLHKYEFQPHLLDLTTLVGIGGVFFGAVGWVMQGKALVPIRDPRLSESLSFENI